MIKRIVYGFIIAIILGATGLQGMGLYDWGKKQLGAFAKTVKNWPEERSAQTESIALPELGKEEELIKQSPLIIGYSKKLLNVLQNPQQLNVLSIEEVMRELIKINHDLNTLYNLKLVVTSNSFDDLQPLYEYRNKLESRFNSLPLKHYEKNVKKEIESQKFEIEKANQRQVADLKKMLLNLRNDLYVLKNLNLAKESKFLYDTDLKTIDKLKTMLQTVRNNYMYIINNPELEKIYDPTSIPHDLALLNGLARKIEALKSGLLLDEEGLESGEEEGEE